jgi:hypothetical protein
MFPFPAVQEICFPLQGTQNDPGVNLPMFIGNRLNFAVEKRGWGLKLTNRRLAPRVVVPYRESLLKKKFYTEFRKNSENVIVVNNWLQTDG